MKERPCPDHSQRARRIERKKINSTQTRDSRPHIRPQVEFAKRPRAREGNASFPDSTGSYPVHPERNHPDPGIAVERIYLESRRKDRESSRREESANAQTADHSTAAPSSNGRLAAHTADGCTALNIFVVDEIACHPKPKATWIKYSEFDHVRERKENSATETDVYAIHGADPEVLAYAMAKYSRSSLTMKESLAEISAQRAEQFLNTFYFQYGHRSIADLAHVPFAIERFSLLAAIVLVDEQRWDGQERSTRYQNFRKSGWYSPDFGAETPTFTAAIEALFTAYDHISAGMLDALKAQSRSRNR